ncbi:hypothetical protein B7494_g4067 [Chlorociboria aeruginascens]|nr:hypothetical protein B7494_g4067 [Chlorociboria aeruginascens]
MPTLSLHRESSPIGIILDPQNNITSEERDIRLEDYLNDKIQTDADFGNVDSLMANVEIQKRQLEEQLQDARSKLAKARLASENHASSILQRNAEFKLRQSDLQKKLMIVTSSNSPEGAVERLKVPMERLRRVEMAREYVEMLKEVDDLTKEARIHLPENPKEALKPYTQLKEVAMALRGLQEPAEGAAVHLVNYVEDTCTQLWIDMKKIMMDEFEAVLKKSNWPSIATEPTRQWTDCFGKLLDLQTPEILVAREPLVLLPMGVLARMFVLQFRYHFMGNKPTSHPHHLGDEFFKWFLGTIIKWEGFLRDNVGPILAAHFRGSALAANSLYVDPVSAFITALLPVLKEKVDSVVIAIAPEPSYLSSFMHQLMTFDETLRSKFYYDAGNAELGWKGLTWEVLDIWFERWVEVEKAFALERYQIIIESPNSGKIDYDSAAPGKTKFTYGASEVMDLLGNVTTQYSKLRRLSHKVRFLIAIQAEVLDRYHGRLTESLDAYSTIMSPVARTLHGITKEEREKLEGIGGLESLCKVFGSADHVISTLQGYTYEEFFVDLWDQLQGRAKVLSVGDNLAGPLSYAEVKDCTSDAVGSGEEGSVFDVTIKGFTAIRNRAEEYIIQAIKSALPASFRSYLTKPQWTTVGDDHLSEILQAELNVTAELVRPLQSLEESMGFLHKALGYPTFRHVLRESIDCLQDLFWNEVLMKEDFTTLGAARFLDDLRGIHDVVDSFVPHGSQTALGMPRLKDGIRLLNLPVDSPKDKIGLLDACNEVFANNEQANALLENLGIVHLSNTNARAILKRRVEASV